MNIPVLIVPGLWGSGSNHWQTIWEQESPEYIRVEQRDWDNPDLNLWMDTLDKYIKKSSSPPVLVAHSLACALVVHWNKYYKVPIKGALLVGPTDCDLMVKRDPEIIGFCPMPMNKLSFDSIVVASCDDECVSFDRAKEFADSWGSEIIDVGNKGHINADSNLGSWGEGRTYLNKLLEQ